jgi:zona occludens toxin (predicted ATPase)
VYVTTFTGFVPSFKEGRQILKNMQGRTGREKHKIIKREYKDKR